MTVTGRVFVWGGGRLGQLGLGDGKRVDVFVPEVHPHLHSPKSLAFGASHGACVTAGGVVKSWGAVNSEGLGLDGFVVRGSVGGAL